jgi:hypothetical protein
MVIGLVGSGIVSAQRRLERSGVASAQCRFERSGW